MPPTNWNDWTKKLRRKQYQHMYKQFRLPADVKIHVILNIQNFAYQLIPFQNFGFILPRISTQNVLQY
jgi:hypothetical protein